MHALQTIVVSNVALAAALALFAFAVTRLWRNPHVAHALWLLVLVKLITPPCAWFALPGSWWPVDRGFKRADATLTQDDQSALPQDAPLATATPTGALASAEAVRLSLDPPKDEGVSPLPSRQSAQPTAEQPEFVADAPPEVISTAPLVPAPAPGQDAAEGLLHGDVNRRSASPRPSEAVTSRPATPNHRSDRPPAISREASLIVCVVWLTGTMAYVVVLARRCWRFRRVMADSIEADAELISEARRLAEALGLRLVPRLRVVDARIPPLVWGFIRRPLVLLPRELLEGLTIPERRSVLLHELAHIRRRDHLVRWLEVLVLVPFWWNPVAWWARRQLREAEEECCDAWVVWALPDSRRSYGQALLRTIEFLSERRAAPAVSGSAFGRFPFKRRIEMILKRETHRKMSWAAWAFVSFLAVGVLPVAAQTTSGVAPLSQEVTAADDAPATPAVEAAPQTSADAAEPAVAAPVLPTTIPLPAASNLPAARPEAGAIPAATRAAAVAEPPASVTPARNAAGAGPAATADRATLEARIERIEALVERLVADRERQDTVARSARASRTGTSAISRGFSPQVAASAAPGSPPRDFHQWLRNTTRRVAVSADRMFAAVLTAGEKTSEIELQDAGSGRVLSITMLNGRATEIRFSPDGRSITVKVGEESRSYQVPNRLLGGTTSDPRDASGDFEIRDGVLFRYDRATSDPRDASGDGVPAQDAAARAAPVDLLREWELQERLLQIDLQQSELKLQGTRLKHEALKRDAEKGFVGRGEIEEQAIAVEQAQLDVLRAQAQLEHHRARRAAIENELSETEHLKRRTRRSGGNQPEAGNLPQAAESGRDASTPPPARR